jgi:hypothetical protein
VFLEAVAAGKPIVAARAAAIPEVVKNGILVEPECSAAIAEGICRLSRDSDLRHGLGAGGGRDVERFFGAHRNSRIVLIRSCGDCAADHQSARRVTCDASLRRRRSRLDGSEQLGHVSRTGF